MVHSMVGTAGTYGFLELSEHARAAEQALEVSLARHSTPSGPERSEIANKITKLCRHLASPESL